MNRSVIQVNKQVCVACQLKHQPEMAGDAECLADKCAQKPLLYRWPEVVSGQKQQDGLHLSAVGNVPPESHHRSQKRNQWTQGREWNNCFLSRNILSGSGTQEESNRLPYKSVCCFRKVRSNCSSSRSQVLVSGPRWDRVGQ